MFQLNNKKAFTLIELIITIAIIALIAAAVFVSVDPAKRIGDTKDAIRASDTVAIEKAMQKAIVENYTIPTAMAALTEDTPYMLVTEGASTSGTCNCNTSDTVIARIDLAEEFKAYLGSDIPVDDDAIGDDTGYYITRKGNSFYIASCNAYEDEFVPIDPCDGTPAIGIECEGGAIYAGTGYTSPLNPADKYMVTPGGCTDTVCTGAGGIDLIAETYQWQTVGTVTGATDNSDGVANVATILAADPTAPAALFCSDMNYGGYTDWFLPAQDELNIVLFVNRVALSGFYPTNRCYWSSTEVSEGWSRRQNFESGGQFTDPKASTFTLVRCIRRY